MERLPVTGSALVPVTTGTSYGVLRSWYLRLQKRSLTLLSHPLLAHFLACMINKNAAVTSALKIWFSFLAAVSRACGNIHGIGSPLSHLSLSPLSHAHSHFLLARCFAMRFSTSSLFFAFTAAGESSASIPLSSA